MWYQCKEYIKASAKFNDKIKEFYEMLGPFDFSLYQPEDEDGELQDNNKIEEARQDMFKRTFRILVRTFESLYKESDFDDEKSFAADFNTLSFDWLKGLIPEFNFNTFGLIGWKRRKIVKQIEECDEDLKEFLENLK